MGGADSHPPLEEKNRSKLLARRTARGGFACHNEGRSAVTLFGAEDLIAHQREKTTREKVPGTIVRVSRLCARL